MFFCQCCPAWYPGQSLIPDEELDTDVGMQQPALHNTTYAKCRVNAEPTVQEMIYWWGFKENHINFIVCYLEVIILRVVASSLGIKKTVFFFWYISFCVEQSFVKWKSKRAPPIINWRMEVKTGLIHNPVCIILCIVLTLLKISLKYLHFTYRTEVFKTRNMKDCFINFICSCSKSNTQSPYNCCLT